MDPRINENTERTVAVPDLSVVILCYRAGHSVPMFVARMKEALEERKLTYELVLVGNYFEADRRIDSTPEVVEMLAKEDPRIVPVVKVKKGMFGWDVRSGLAAARGANIAFIDGDGQNPYIDVLRVYDHLRETQSDMATVYRVRRYDGTRRIFISRIFNVMLRILFPQVSVYDTNAKPKIFTRAAYEKLHLTSNDWFVDAEIIIQATRAKFLIAQLPTVFLKQQGRSSFVTIKTLFEFIVNLVYYRIFGYVR